MGMDAVIFTLLFLLIMDLGLWNRNMANLPAVGADHEVLLQELEAASGPLLACGQGLC